MADQLDEIETRLAVAVLLAPITWRDDKLAYYGRDYGGMMPTERALLAAVAAWQRAKGRR